MSKTTNPFMGMQYPYLNTLFIALTFQRMNLEQDGNFPKTLRRGELNRLKHMLKQVCEAIDAPAEMEEQDEAIERPEYKEDFEERMMRAEQQHILNVSAAYGIDYKTLKEFYGRLNIGPTAFDRFIGNLFCSKSDRAAKEYITSCVTDYGDERQPKWRESTILGAFIVAATPEGAGFWHSVANGHRHD